MTVRMVQAQLFQYNRLLLVEVSAYPDQVHHFIDSSVECSNVIYRDKSTDLLLLIIRNQLSKCRNRIWFRIAPVGFQNSFRTWKFSIIVEKRASAHVKRKLSLWTVAEAIPWSARIFCFCNSLMLTLLRWCLNQTSYSETPEIQYCSIMLGSG